MAGRGMTEPSWKSKQPDDGALAAKYGALKLLVYEPLSYYRSSLTTAHSPPSMEPLSYYRSSLTTALSPLSMSIHQ